jgi:hypothetical protein
MIKRPGNDDTREQAFRALCDELTAKCSPINDQLDELMPYSFSADEGKKRLELEWILAGYYIEHEKRVLELNYILPVSVSDTTGDGPTDQNNGGVMLDFLPDLALIRVLNNIDNHFDIKALVTVLNDPQRIEDSCFARFRECWELIGRDSRYLTVCDNGFCRIPTTCMRCFLYSKGKCIKCGSLADLPWPNHTNLDSCDFAVTTGTGKITKCRDTLSCQFCAFVFRADEKESVTRVTDFLCPCPLERHELMEAREGCINCTRECNSCANVGCFLDSHFRINDWDGEGEWPKCADCKHPHCCAVATQSIYSISEWDYCVCPQLKE